MVRFEGTATWEFPAQLTLPLRLDDQMENGGKNANVEKDKEDHIERAAGSIKNARDLYYYAHATKLLSDQNEEKGANPLKSEAFYRFAGATFGAIIAAAVLMFSQFFSIATNNITLLKTNRDELARSVESLNSERDVLIKHLEGARDDLETKNLQLSNAKGEIEDATKALDELQERVSIERLGGAVLRICEIGLIRPLFSQISQEYELPDRRSFVEASLHIYLLNDGELPYTLYTRAATGSRFSERRAEEGDWKATQDKVAIHLAIRDKTVRTLVFNRRELERFVLEDGGQDQICAISGTERWCFPATNCTR